MRINLRLPTGAAALALLGLALSAGPASAQQTPFYIFAGDQDTGFIVQNGLMIQSFNTSAAGLGYPVAVRNTVWLGDRDNNGAVEYTLGGVPTGNTSAGAGGFSQILDGTANATNNFGIIFSTQAGTDAVTIAGPDWAGQAILFNLPTDGDAESITFDPSTNSLFIGYFGGSLEQRTLAGALLNTFTPGVELSSMAYEALTDTLWVAPNGSSQVVQLSKTGVILDEIDVVAGPGQTFGGFLNNYGGEMPFGGQAAAAPEPGSIALALMGFSALGLVARRKR